jgi:creatinine amidohydrolase/Fe(II)-dependent formamide hydrolase-like protein
MIEQHGPHLPVGADTIAVTYEADGAARRVSRALPAWNVVVMPAVNYGHSGANQLGGKPIHPGTYAIRQSTLRSLVADLGAQIAQNGFKWIFVMNGHGAPTHNIAINEACESRAGRSLEELRTIATAPGWQGYLSAPARSTAEHGRAVEDWWMQGFTDLILRAVGGENLFGHARVPDSIPGAVAPILERELANETAFEEKLENWLVQRRRH